MRTPKLLNNLLIATLLAGSVSAARAADRVKADNITALNATASWTGAVVPTARTTRS